MGADSTARTKTVCPKKPGYGPVNAYELQTPIEFCWLDLILKGYNKNMQQDV